MKTTVKKWFGDGSPWVWLNAGAVAISLVLVIGLLALIAVRGLGHFWPAQVLVAEYQVPGQGSAMVAGEVVETEEVSAQRLQVAGMPVPDDEEFMLRKLLKVGNRDVSGADFVWVLDYWLHNRSYPKDIMALERREWGNFYGYLQTVKESRHRCCSGRSCPG